MHKTDTLAQRLRALADEIESAERYGIPLPTVVSVSSYDGQDVSWHMPDPAEFDAWADYIEADVQEYDYNGRHVRTAEADVLGLAVRISTSTALVTT